MKQYLKQTLLASVVAIAGMPAYAQDTLKATFTDPDDPVTSSVSSYMHVFKNELERIAGEDFKVDLYPNGQLGDQRSTVQQVARGSIHFANVASGVLASLYYPKLGIVDLPFLFDSRTQFNEMMSRDDPYIAQLLDELAAETGIRVISLHANGFRNLTTKNSSVCAPEDLKGLRIRTMEVVPHQKMIEALGATAVPIPYLELYTSLQTGVVDGQENPPSQILQQRFYQVQGYMSETHHVMTVGAHITNEAWWQSLTDEQRGAILAANKEASLALDGTSLVQNMLGVQKIRDEGVEVCTPSQEQMAAFRAAVVGPTKEWAVQEFGAEFVDTFFAHMDSFKSGD